jgi:hypothetical protein
VSTVRCLLYISPIAFSWRNASHHGTLSHRHHLKKRPSNYIQCYIGHRIHHIFDSSNSIFQLFCSWLICYFDNLDWLAVFNSSLEPAESTYERRLPCVLIKKGRGAVGKSSRCFCTSLHELVGLSFISPSIRRIHHSFHLLVVSIQFPVTLLLHSFVEKLRR